jgi:GNAT superfamily N-acetyltransferase
MITIRTALHDDAPALLGLWRDLMDEQHRLDVDFEVADDAGERWLNDFHEWVEAPDVRRVVVADAGSGIVGFASAQLWWPPPIYRQEMEVYLDELFVRSEDRRQGIGTRLLESIREWGDEQEVSRITLGTLAANDDAVRFWKKRGGKEFLVSLIIPIHTTSD